MPKKQKDKIKFLNRNGVKFDWDNNKLADNQTPPREILHPELPANFPRIELEKVKNITETIPVPALPVNPKQGVQ